MPADLQRLADAIDAELWPVDLVHEDGIGVMKVREGARDDVPGTAEPGFTIDPDDLNSDLLTVRRPSPLRRSRNVLARRGHSGRRRKDHRSLPLRERDALLDVWDVGCGNPNVGA